jgi:hypothetical protein
MICNRPNMRFPHRRRCFASRCIVLAARFQSMSTRHHRAPQMVGLRCPNSNSRVLYSHMAEYKCLSRAHHKLLSRAHHKLRGQASRTLCIYPKHNHVFAPNTRSRTHRRAQQTFLLKAYHSLRCPMSCHLHIRQRYHHSLHHLHLAYGHLNYIPSPIVDFKHSLTMRPIISTSRSSSMG